MSTKSIKAKLISVSETVLENSNGTQYRVATAEFQGKVFSVRIWEKNYAKGMVEGNTYTVNLEKYIDNNGQTQIDAVMSPLVAAERLTEDFYDSLPGTVSEKKTNAVDAASLV